MAKSFRHFLLFAALLPALFASPGRAAPEAFQCSYFFGRLTSIPVDAGNSAFSTISRNRMIVLSGEEFLVHDLATGVISRFPYKSSGRPWIVSFDDSLALAQSVNDPAFELAVFDLKTGEKRILARVENPGFPLSLSQEKGFLRGRSITTPFDSSRKEFVYKTGLRDIHVVPADGSGARVFSVPGEVESFYLNGNGKAMVVLKGRQPLLLDLKTGSQMPVEKIGLTEPQLAYVDSASMIFRSEKEGEGLARLDLKTGKVSPIEIPGLDEGNLVVTPNGVVFGKKVENYVDEVSYLDFGTGQIKSLGGRVQSFLFDQVQVSEDGKQVVWFDGEIGRRSSASIYKYVNLESGASKDIEIPGSRSIAMRTGMSGDGRYLASGVMSHDESARVMIWDLQSGSSMEVKIGDLSSINNLDFSEGGTLVIQRYSGAPILADTKDWKAFSSGAVLPARSPKADLKTLARKGDLRLARDFPEMLTFFRNGAYKKDPETAALFLMQVLDESPNTYSSILKDFPDLLPLLKEHPLELSRLSRGVRKKWMAAARSHLELKLNSLSTETKADISSFDELVLLRPFLAELPRAEKSAAIHKIADVLSRTAAGTVDSPLENIFLPKLDKFIKQEVHTWFGDPPRHFTDYMVVRNENTLRPVIIGTRPIDGDPATATRFGIYARSFDPITIGAEQKEGTLVFRSEIKWKQGKESFTGNIEVKTKTDLGSLIPNSPAPAYEEMWKDGKLTGLVTTGENLQSANPDLIKEYLSYYRSQGFRFNKPVPVEDMPAFLEEQIKSGRLDYFIKEAHTDGMENDLFRIYTKGSVQTGTRKLEDGTEEVVHIFHPDPDGATSLISNDQFGAWVRAREKSDKGPLTYFNTSCWGADKACHEYQAAASGKLLVIAPSDSAETFIDAEESALRQLLTGFREKKSYAEIRELMKKDPTYAAGSGNTYLFPDEEAFDEKIRKSLLTAIEVKSSVKDGKGNPYHLDIADIVPNRE